jgi:hypothetical protein
MKKILVLVIVLLLGACEQASPFDIRQELVSTLKSQSSFVVSERFEWQRFGVLNEGPWNEFVEKDHAITFQNNRYLVDHSIDIETNNNRVMERTLFQAQSYKNIYSRDAAVRINRQWYNLDLPLINPVGLGSLDPVAVVTELLYSNIEWYTKSETGVTGDTRTHRFAVVTISDTVFRQLFEHTVMPHVDVPYRYTVTAELAFGDDYRITSIDFDLTRLLREYRDYFTVQQGATILSLSGRYQLQYHSYNNVVVPNLPSGVTLQPTTESFSDLESVVEQSDWLAVSIRSEDHGLQITGTMLRPARLLLIEVQGLKDERTSFLTQQQFVSLKNNQTLTLPAFDASEFSRLIISIRVIDQRTSRVISETFDVTALFLSQIEG